VIEFEGLQCLSKPSGERITALLHRERHRPFPTSMQAFPGIDPLVDFARQYDAVGNNRLKPYSAKVVQPYVRALRDKVAELQGRIHHLSQNNSELGMKLMAAQSAEIMYRGNLDTMKTDIINLRERCHPGLHVQDSNDPARASLEWILRELLMDYEAQYSECERLNNRNAELEHQAKEQQLASHADTITRQSGQGTSSEDLYDLRNLIRGKYSLDIEIWSLRDVHTANQYLVEERKKRSDGALDEIRKAVETWKGHEHRWTEEEMPYVEEIYQRISSISAGQYSQLPSR